MSPEFKLYIATEFKRRALLKINYKIHTEAIKNNLIPKSVTKEQT